MAILSLLFAVSFLTPGAFTLALPKPQNSASFADNAQTAYDRLQQFYNTNTGLWDTTGWWNSANCMTVVGNLAITNSQIQTSAVSVFANTYHAAQGTQIQMKKEVSTSANPIAALFPYLPTSYYGAASAPGFSPLSSPNSPSPASSVQPQSYAGFINDYYDDEGWWTHAWIRAYDVTGNADYLSLAQNIFADMTNGWNATRCGGGIWWDKAHTYVNAIANELFLSAAAHLANRVAAGDKQYYEDWATKAWTWFEGSGMINAQSTINDGLAMSGSSCTNNGGTVWSYNQGVVLGGLAELNRATGDTKYITVMHDIASAGIAALSTGGILHDPCEPDCGGDGSQFKGVFLRNLQQVQQLAGSDAYRTFIEDNAESIWSADRDASNTLGLVWSGPAGATNASTHSSAMDALVAAAVVG